jgi:hypothetical protein
MTLRSAGPTLKGCGALKMLIVSGPTCFRKTRLPPSANKSSGARANATQACLRKIKA